HAATLRVAHESGWADVALCALVLRAAVVHVDQAARKRAAQHPGGSAGERPHRDSLPFIYNERMAGGSGASSKIPEHARAFGKYSLLTRLATGGMAEIFLARLSGAAGFQKHLVLKRILPQYAEDEHFVAMFLDEARIAAQISHPNVCQVYELGEVEGQYFLTMEYLDGVPLASLMRPASRPPRAADTR